MKNDLVLFVDEEGMPWASPSFDACTSWIFLGVSGGASPSLSFCPFFILLHHSSLPTLKNFLHTKLITIFISSVSAIIIIKSTKFSMTYEKHAITIIYCNTSFKKVLWSRELKKKGIKRQMQNSARICQNRTVHKDQFFIKCYAAQIEQISTNES